MNSKHLRKNSLRLGIFVFLFSYNLCWALGLGDITVESTLHSPLKAKIQLLAINPEDINNIKVKLASARDFDWVGIERSVELEQLNFSLSINGKGKPYISVSTGTPVQKQSLNFLIEIKWPQGRLLREYTIRLKQAPKPAPTTAIIEPTTQVDESSVDTSTDSPIKMGISSKEKIKTLQIQNTYTTARGDTLSKIIDKFYKNREFTVEQMMIAILRSNPQAFINNNINGLKSGVTLRFPSSEEIKLLGAEDASAEVKLQYVDWRQKSIRTISRETPVAKTDAKKIPEAIGGTLEIATEQAQNESKNSLVESTDKDNEQPTEDNLEEDLEENELADSGPPPEGRLEILTQDEERIEADTYAVEMNDYIESLERSANLAQELAESRRQEVLDVKQRVKRLETVISQQERLITLQNEQMAQFNQQIIELKALRQTEAPPQQSASNNNIWLWFVAVSLVLLIPGLYAVYRLYRRLKLKISNNSTSVNSTSSH